MPKAIKATSNKKAFWLFFLALVVATLLAYLPALHGNFLWDDDSHVTRPELRSWQGLADIWVKPGATQQYYPLVHSAFWIEHQLWGDAVLPYHLVNVLLHASSAALLFLILRRLRLKAAWLAAAIFALHPLEVESVAWISELKNTLSGFLFLAAALLYLDFDERRSRGRYFASLALFFLALMSKSVTATLPAALLVTFWWQRGLVRYRRDVLPLLPFFLLGITAGVVTALVERNQIGASGSDFEFSFVARCLIAARATWFYLGKLLFPVNLTFIYPRWQIDAHSWWQYLFVLGVILLLLVSYFLRKQSRAPLACLLLFTGLLFPALGFVNVYPFIFSFVADHFQYLAGIAVIVFVSAGIARVGGRAGLAVPALLGFLTWQQAHIYTDPQSLYDETLRKNPACWMAHNNQANLFLRKGDVEEAIRHYEEAVRLRPRYLEAEFGLGNALLQRGDVTGALAHCNAALAIDSQSAEAHNNLANALRKQRKFGEAIAHYERALVLSHYGVVVKNNLAWILATCADRSLRDPARAVKLAGEASEQSQGKNAVFLHTLSAAYVESGDLEQGYKTALRAKALAIAQGNQALVNMLEKELAQLKPLLESKAAGQLPDLPP